MKISKIFSHKLVLHCCNFAFMLCGFTIFICGIYLISDENRILLSRLLGATNEKLADLPKPLFYYVAIGLSATGMLIILTSLIGCWAAFLNRCCILFMYFTLVFSLLLVEFGVCLLVTMWPHCLGPNLNATSMVKVLQGNYGIAGHEQFTSAMDLAQTIFECCAINSDINYDTSLWRLQGLGQRDWVVPLTCCHISNRFDIGSYLDPKPYNLTQCQALLKYEYEGNRHLNGCLEKVEQWYREQYLLFLIGGLAIAIVEFCVLLGIILSCTKLQKKKVKTAITTTSQSSCTNTNTNTLSIQDNIYQQKELPPITELKTFRRERYSDNDPNTVGLWSRWTPTSQY